MGWMGHMCPSTPMLNFHNFRPTSDKTTIFDKKNELGSVLTTHIDKNHAGYQYEHAAGLFRGTHGWGYDITNGGLQPVVYEGMLLPQRYLRGNFWCAPSAGTWCHTHHGWEAPCEISCHLCGWKNLVRNLPPTHVFCSCKNKNSLSTPVHIMKGKEVFPDPVGGGAPRLKQPKIGAHQAKSGSPMNTMPHTGNIQTNTMLMGKGSGQGSFINMNMNTNMCNKCEMLQKRNLELEKENSALKTKLSSIQSISKDH